MKNYNFLVVSAQFRESKHITILKADVVCDVNSGGLKVLKKWVFNFEREVPMNRGGRNTNLFAIAMQFAAN